MVLWITLVDTWVSLFSLGDDDDDGTMTEGILRQRENKGKSNGNFPKNNHCSTTWLKKCEDLTNIHPPSILHGYYYVVAWGDTAFTFFPDTGLFALLPLRWEPDNDPFFFLLDFFEGCCLVDTESFVLWDVCWGANDDPFFFLPLSRSESSSLALSSSL